MQGGVLASVPYAPLTAFFIRGRNILFQISGGAYLEGGICPPCFESAGACAPYEPLLHTPLAQAVNQEHQPIKFDGSHNHISYYLTWVRLQTTADFSS